MSQWAGQLLAACAGSYIQVWSPFSGSGLVHSENLSSSVTTVRWSPNRRAVAYGDTSGQFYTLANGQVGPDSMHFSPACSQPTPAVSCMPACPLCRHLEPACLPLMAASPACDSAQTAGDFSSVPATSCTCWMSNGRSEGTAGLGEAESAGCGCLCPKPKP